MLTIFAESFGTAARQNSWGAPMHWKESEGRPETSRRNRQRRQGDLRRWLRDSGIM